LPAPPIRPPAAIAHGLRQVLMLTRQQRTGIRREFAQGIRLGIGGRISLGPGGD